MGVSPVETSLPEGLSERKKDVPGYTAKGVRLEREREEAVHLPEDGDTHRSRVNQKPALGRRAQPV